MPKDRKERIDVFISSTSEDLTEHRAAVRDAILNLKLFPSGMENWPVTGKPPVDLCRDMVRDAEIYVGIYAYRYGWQPEDDGPSITEMEYDWAGEDGIPRLCFVMDDGHPWPEDRKEQEPEKQARLKAFKARVKADQVGFFTTPDDLKAQVIAALAPYAGKLGSSVALRPYLNWLHGEAKKCGLLRVMDASTVDPSRKGQQVTVDEVYTPLDTRRTVFIDKNGKIINAQEDQELIRREKSWKSRPFSAMDAANFNDRLVLLGDPGSGKSTFVSFLALCLAGAVVEAENGWLDHLEKQGWGHGALLPVRVVLREFAEALPSGTEGNARVLGDFIEAEVTRHGCTDTAPLQQALDHGDVFLMLDGLDEVPNDKREAVRDAITDFMGAHPKMRVIVTCRILSYTNKVWQIPDLPAETLAPFNWDQIDQFVGAWYRASQAARLIEPDLAETRIGDLKKALRDNQLEGPASNPMLLTVMALVHNHTGSLPRENARLYAECVELLMFRWKPVDAGWLKDELNAREDDIYRALWELAYAAHEEQADKDGPADITESTVIGVMRKRFGDIQKAQTFCDYVEERAGLLVGRGESRDGWKVFTFPHRTFQEYLAGCHIANGRRSLRRRFKEKALAGAGWREVLRLAAGHLVFNDTDIESTIDAVAPLIELEPESDEHWRAVWLAGEIFNLIGGERVATDEEGRDLLPQAQHQLAALISEGQLDPVERAAAGRTLSILGDPRPGVGLRDDGLPDIDWVEISAGPFQMGNDKAQDDQAYDDELPQITVDLPTYYMARYPVTYKQYQAFIDAEDGFHNPQWWDGLAASDEHKQSPDEQYFKYWNHPREDVSWYDAVAFCRWLSAKVGYEVRLPTEAEWEKAARGADGRIYPYGDEFDSAKGNTSDTGIRQTSAVGMFRDPALPYGLLDMSGNVFEWCMTKWGWKYVDGIDAMDNTPEGDNVRVVRGGSFGDALRYARCAFRNFDTPDNRSYSQGFRVVCSRPPSGLLGAGRGF
jgi:formylglycine-generating enzyme required for sulfatase activity